MRELLYRFNPAVPNRLLMLLAGLIWTSVGAFLFIRAIGWIDVQHETQSSLFVASGVVAGLVWNRVMFSKVAARNVSRIARLPEHACVFAFTAWRGYALIVLMIVLGIFLRNSSIPKQYLAGLYAAMGGALFFSSFVFYRSYWKSERAGDE